MAVRERLKEFDGLRIMMHRDADEIRRAVRRNEIALSTSDAIEDRLGIFVVLICFLPMCSGIGLLLIFTNPLFKQFNDAMKHASPGVVPYGLKLVSAVVALLIIFLIGARVLVPRVRFPSAKFDELLFLPTLLVLVLCSIGGDFAGQTASSGLALGWVQSILLAGTVWSTALSSLILAAVLSSPLVIWLDRRRMALLTGPVVSRRLIMVLRKLEKGHLRWADTSYRQSIRFDLEKIAGSVQYGWPKGLGVKDDVDRQSCERQRSDEVAAAFRSLKFWLFNPKLDTRKQLVERLATDLEKISRADWDALCGQPAVGGGKPDVFRSIRRAIFRIAIAFLPIGVMALAAHLGVPVSKGFLGWFYPAAVLWIILNIIHGLDSKAFLVTSANLFAAKTILSKFHGSDP